MGIKKYKPTTSTLRWTAGSDYRDVAKKRPEKSLVCAKKSSGGRNSSGRITARHRGGGHKKKVRIVDYKRDKYGPEPVYVIYYLEEEFQKIIK